MHFVSMAVGLTATFLVKHLLTSMMLSYSQCIPE